MLLKKFIKIISQKKIICLDLDGVLIDTIENMRLSWDKTMLNNNISVPFDNYKKYIGLPFEEILKKINISNNVKQIKKDYRKNSLKYKKKIKPIRELIKFVNYLYRNKFIIIIITSKELFRAKKFLNKFKIINHHIITPEKLNYGKPNKEAIDIIIRKFKLKKRYLIYFGDTKIDYKFSVNSGIDYIHCNWGYGNLNYKNSIELKQINYLNENFKYNYQKKKFEKNKK